MPLSLEIVTPDARVYSDTIDSVVIPTIEGEVGILPGHIPLLTQVANGELREDAPVLRAHRAADRAADRGETSRESGAPADKSSARWLDKPAGPTTKDAAPAQPERTRIVLRFRVLPPK